MLYKLVRGVAAFIIKAFSVTEVYGRENIISGNVIFICNHQSMIDAFINFTVLPEDTHFMAKKELFSFKPVAKLMLKINMFPVNRSKPDLSTVRNAYAVLQNNGNLCIYPQGTRTSSPVVEQAQMHDGVATFAIKCNSKIVPMMFKDKPKLFKKNVLYIGKPIDISDFAAKGVNKTNVGELTSSLATQMNALLSEGNSRYAIK